LPAGLARQPPRDLKVSDVVNVAVYLTDKASEIYPRPIDPALQKEYNEWLARKKAELGIK
jgi:hypothetical protein